MKKSVFLAYAEDSDDDVQLTHHNGDKSAKNTKQKQKQKAKKQEENALKCLAMTTSTKKSKKKKSGSNAEAAKAPQQEIDAAAVTEQLEQVTIKDTPVAPPVEPTPPAPPAPPAVAQPTASVPSYADASKKKKATQQQKQTPSTQQAGKQTPEPPAQTASPSPQESNRLASPPPQSTPSITGVKYVPSQIKVLLPGQPEQVLEVEDVMARAQYFKQTAESLMAVNRNGEMENIQLREHLTQALHRLEQLEHDNRILQQLNVNLQTEVAAFRMSLQNGHNGAYRPPPGL